MAFVPQLDDTARHGVFQRRWNTESRLLLWNMAPLPVQVVDMARRSFSYTPDVSTFPSYPAIAASLRVKRYVFFVSSHLRKQELLSLGVCALRTSSGSESALDTCWCEAWSRASRGCRIIGPKTSKADLRERVFTCKDKSAAGAAAPSQPVGSEP